MQWLRIIRPWQWIKNLMLYFPPFLGGVFLERCLTPYSLIPFTAFCLASSSSYILNDLCDRHSDLHHPRKCTRPIACGAISPNSAYLVALLFMVCATLLAWSVSAALFWYLFVYVLLSLAYTLALKHSALIDIFCISAAFLLRLKAGGAVFSVPVSEWLFLSVFLLAIFLSVGKRLSEKQQLGPEAAASHRKSLAAYPAGFLEGALNMSGAAVLVTYTMYVVSRKSECLLYSVPVCCYGLMRYILRISSGKGGDPTETLLKDWQMLIVGVLWVVLVACGVYGR